MSQKRSDFEVIPMCRTHHAEQHRIGWPQFIRKYELDVQGILAELRERPRIEIVLYHHWTRPNNPRIVFGANYRGCLFDLLPVSEGLRRSVECAFRVCGEYLRDQLRERHLKKAS